MSEDPQNATPPPTPSSPAGPPRYRILRTPPQLAQLGVLVRWLQTSPRNPIIAAILSLVVCGSCCTGTFASAHNGSPRDDTAAPTDIPTFIPPPQPTDTPIPQPVSGGVLGGTVNDFDAAFGYPSPDGTTISWSTYDSGAGDSVSIIVDSTDGKGTAIGTDGQRRIISFALAVPGVYDPSIWAASDALTAYSSLLPEDANLANEVQASGSPIDERLYASDDLAATFPVALFHDSKGKSVIPGAFTVSCFPMSALVPGSEVGYCRISVGDLFNIPES